MNTTHNATTQVKKLTSPTSTCKTIQSKGGAMTETGGNRPPTPHKVHFCKSSKTDEKMFEVYGVTLPTILEFQPEFVTSDFQRLDLTYILPNC